MKATQVMIAKEIVSIWGYIAQMTKNHTSYTCVYDLQELDELKEYYERLDLLYNEHRLAPGDYYGED